MRTQVNLFSGAIFIQQALDWNIYLSIFVLLALASICTIGEWPRNKNELTSRLIFRLLGGGLAAVIYVDVVQVTIMILGSSLVLYKGLEEVGGWNALQEK